jgi:hypothetical protein
LRLSERASRCNLASADSSRMVDLHRPMPLIKRRR